MVADIRDITPAHDIDLHASWLRHCASHGWGDDVQILLENAKAFRQKLDDNPALYLDCAAKLQAFVKPK